MSDRDPLARRWPYPDGMAPCNDLNQDDLGPGWEETERALANVQADLSRTVADAPTLVLLWRDADPDCGSAEDDVPDGRWAYVGKSDVWYFGANGGFPLSRNYAYAVEDIATEVSGAVTDTLLGRYAYWPHCPDDDSLLVVRLDADRRCWWSCRSANDPGNHLVTEVGQLPAPRR